MGDQTDMTGALNGGFSQEDLDYFDNPQKYWETHAVAPDLPALVDTPSSRLYQYQTADAERAKQDPQYAEWLNMQQDTSLSGSISKLFQSDKGAQMMLSGIAMGAKGILDWQAQRMAAQDRLDQIDRVSSNQQAAIEADIKRRSARAKIGNSIKQDKKVTV